MGEASTDENFPTAKVTPARTGILRLMVRSKMWWATLACLVIAIGFALSSLRPAGPSISITFPEGHGLKTGDALQHRGIHVGTVKTVQLAEDFESVTVVAVLDPSAAGIANEGSRFWIVRPQFSLTGVSGLETAVGSKYIAVDPGTSSEPSCRVFAGLAEPLSQGLDHDGVMVRLQADRSQGITAGAAVTYRGVNVGTINDIVLSDDSMSVTATALVDHRYRNLVRKGSKFWASSGIDVGFGLTGLKLNTDSLATIARGGIAFITPNSSNPKDLEPPENDWIFKLHEKVDEDWIEDAATIEL